MSSATGSPPPYTHKKKKRSSDLFSGMATEVLKSVKTLAESTGFSSVPSTHAFYINSNDFASSKEDEDSIPVIDFSLLTSSNQYERSKAVELLGKACEDWGFFMLVNHGVDERFTKEVMEACMRFFDLPDEEKREFQGKHALDPIIYGTSFNTSDSLGKVYFWRDFIKMEVNPKFHCPTKPPGFREVVEEFSKETRRIIHELLKGISESLGLEPTYANEAMNTESGFQQFAANLYPPCPNPESAIGLPAHTDHGLLTLLTQNGVGGLQIQHNQKWVNVNAIPNAFLINTGDHLEIMTNGKYKGVMHRAVVNNKCARISIAVPCGPSPDTVVSPAPELVDSKSNPAAYIGMKCRDYLELKYDRKFGGKSSLDHVKINLNN
jgi:isopenicillin N synthase-like dioxygenase